jgi:AraC-like DNA-binding protein
MGLFKTKAEKEFDKKMAIKKTINEMNKQIEKLEKSEQYFLDVAKKAKEQNLPSQLTLAINALKSTIAQKKKVQEMLLNFQIMTQTKDMLLTTSEFLKGMGSLSKDMAKLCNISCVYFRRIFANAFGLSPIKYVNNLKIERAKELLRSRLYSVTEVCEIAGFSDPAYFCRLFKKEVGVTPSEFCD